MSERERTALDRRGFLRWMTSRGAGFVLAATAGPTLLAACGSDDDAGDRSGASRVSGPSKGDGEAIVGDVVDFSLTPDGWSGPFGFVTMALHEGLVDGGSVWFVRTDSSDRAYGEAERLVFVPRIAPLADDALSGRMYVADVPDQPPVLSTEPGRADYTPAWTLHRITWSASPRRLSSEQEVRQAAAAGALAVERTAVVINAGIVKWSAGEMAVDRAKQGYLGEGMLLDPVDTVNRRATFKLGQCYPASRYFVLDHSMEGPAAMTRTTFSPKLQDGPSRASATGRTNVFMNGLEGPGPMGFQPSAFDFDAGHPAWSPYWDHYTYAWKDNVAPKLLTTQAAIHERRDDGDLEEFPGVPDTKGTVFTVNCPVPVLADPSFRA